MLQREAMREQDLGWLSKWPNYILKHEKYGGKATICERYFPSTVLLRVQGTVDLITPSKKYMNQSFAEQPTHLKITCCSGQGGSNRGSSGVFGVEQTYRWRSGN